MSQLGLALSLWNCGPAPGDCSEDGDPIYLGTGLLYSGKPISFLARRYAHCLDANPSRWICTGRGVRVRLALDQPPSI